MSRERGVFVVRGAVRRVPVEALEGLRGRLEDWWEERHRPEVEPPDIDEDAEVGGGPIIPAEPDDPEIWPPLELVPPPQPNPEYFYVACYHPSIGLRYVKIHGPTMKERMQALKDRLPAGGIGGRPPQRPMPSGD